MSNKNKSRSKIIKFLNGRTFYVVLCLCFVAIGIAAWSGVEGMKILDAEKQNNSTSSVNSGSGGDVLQVIPPISSVITPSFDENDQNDNAESETEAINPTESETDEVIAPVATFFVNPVLGEVIKDFSDTELQYSMTMCDMRLHKAVDLKANEGTPVIASGSGIVTDVYTDVMLGSVVEIDHGNGITAKYCGLNEEPFVKKGDTVDSSKQIGTVGVIPSESVEQRHIHLEFFKNGKAVSPMNYIQQ